ncbi:MAG TPA: RluA family pseudouridine synthase [Levilinea sp.]|nr:RluA family pseudouridine synthase [Levilinea sp.]
MSEQVRIFRYERQVGQRLDKFLVENLPGFSRSQVQNLIKDSKVTVDDKPVTKTGFSVAHDHRVEICIPVPEPTELVPEYISLDIVFENQDLVVINKPAGMVVHPAAGHTTGTLVHAVLAHAPEMQGVHGERRPGVVHRLDKDTSGLIMIAKHDGAHRWLQNQFRSRKVRKVYLTLVDGHPPTPTGRIEAPIGRDKAFRRRMAVVPSNKGRDSVTEYLVLERFEQFTYLEAHPLTGRTHQIRIHLAFLGCPIVGDTLYGHRHPTVPVSRHFLHAARLTVQLPGETSERTFEAPLSPELVDALRWVRER